MPYKGNEKEFEKVNKLLEGGLGNYRIALIDLSDEGLAALLDSNEDEGYMPRHMEAAGFKDLPDSIDWQKDEDPFYKGGLIRDIDTGEE